jgi:branched-chain amino acid transport system substrate-binding protein
MSRDTSTGTRGPSRRRVLQTVGAGVAASSLAGCADLLAGGDDGGLGDTLRIGVIASEPESDPITASIVAGAEIAAQELTDDGGVLGADTVEISVGNAGENASNAGDAYSELVLDEDVHVTIGNFFSEGLIEILDDVADEQKLHLVTGASTIEMSEALREDYERYKYLFRVGPFNNVYLGQTLVDFAAEYYQDPMGWETTAVLREEAAWTPPAAEVLSEQLGNHGFDVVDTVSYAPDQSNFSPIFDDLQSQGIDGVTTLMAATGATAAGQWAGGGYDFDMGGIHVPAQLPGISSSQQLGPAINNVWTVNTASQGATITDRTEPFTQAYLDAQERPPVYTGYLSYDAIHLLAAYAEELGTIDDEELIDAMAANEVDVTTTTVENFRFWEPDEETQNGQTYPHDIAYDRDTWLENGESAPIINQWQDGSLEIVAPEDQATAAYQQLDR